jgi:hypothetical protein
MDIRLVRPISDDFNFGLTNPGFNFGLSEPVCGCTRACVRLLVLLLTRRRKMTRTSSRRLGKPSPKLDLGSAGPKLKSSEIGRTNLSIALNCQWRRPREQERNGSVGRKVLGGCLHSESLRTGRILQQGQHLPEFATYLEVCNLQNLCWRASVPIVPSL